MEEQIQYPEHKKLKAIADKSQAIGEFMEWLLENKGVFLACYDDSIGGSKPIIVSYNYRTTGLLADYFDIDEKKLEEEKQQMLDGIRKLNEQ